LPTKEERDALVASLEQRYWHFIMRQNVLDILILILCDLSVFLETHRW